MKTMCTGRLLNGQPLRLIKYRNVIAGKGVCRPSSESPRPSSEIVLIIGTIQNIFWNNSEFGTKTRFSERVTALIFVIFKFFDLLDLNIFDVLAKPKYFQGQA